MPKTRKCAYCDKVFTTNSGIQKYCSEECAEQAKESRKRKQKDFFHFRFNRQMKVILRQAILNKDTVYIRYKLVFKCCC